MIPGIHPDIRIGIEIILDFLRFSIIDQKLLKFLELLDLKDLLEELDLESFLEIDNYWIDI